jgi:sulfur-oxidizing protein SoxY
MNLNRRQMLARTVGASLIGLFGTAKNVFAGPEEVATAIKEFAGGAEVGSGKLTLVAPEIAENGNSVPIAVSVESPMSEDDYVESVVLYAEGNPLPNVITFNFSPASGEASASTRMRLAKTQNVVAVAKMSDGSVVSDTRNIKVTIGGCGG